MSSATGARSCGWRRDGSLAPGGAEGFGIDELDELTTLRLTVGPGPVGKAVESRMPTLVAREHARPTALADAFDIDSPLVIVPLMPEGRLLGLLTVEVATPIGRSPRLSGRDLRILATIATEASLALDNARLHAELRDLSVTDALTGVYNHRYFQQRLQEELDRSVRKSVEGGTVPVSLILMDIDFFKKVNDRFGHPSGDELLRSFAKLTGRVLRSSDVVCRYGGEEFAIILPETDASEALRVAERLREAVERSNFAGADGRYLGKVTASFGVETHAEGLPSRGEMIQRSDDAMYAAKESGRNRVVHADDLARSAGTERAGVDGQAEPGADRWPLRSPAGPPCCGARRCRAPRARARRRVAASARARARSRSRRCRCRTRHRGRRPRRPRRRRASARRSSACRRSGSR